MNVTTVVFAYGGGNETVKRHLPIWKAYTDNLLIVSPQDNPCILNGIDCLTFEKNQRLGPHSLARQLFGMKASLGYNSDFYVFLEYDAIMLKRPEPRPIIQGNLYNHRFFLSKDKKAVLDENLCFLHFPWIFPADKLKYFVDNVKLDPKDGVPQDVWMIQRIMELDLEVHNLLGFGAGRPHTTGFEGYSHVSIFSDTPERLERAINTINRGGYAFHGIKTKDVLEQILNAANQTHFLSQQ